MGINGDKRWLSNMYVFNKPVVVDGEVIKSSENYYMSRKTNDVELRKKILEMTPIEAKEFCKDIELVDGWNEIRVDVMREALRIKFSIPYLRLKLLSYNGELTEYNTCSDKFWGVCNGEGSDNLGRLLRELKKDVHRQDSILLTVRYGNLYDSDIDYKCFTSNATLNKEGELVMGAGSALTIKGMYPELPKVFGSMLKNRKTYGAMIDYSSKIIAFQTKVDWKEDSKTNIIKNSVYRLHEMMNSMDDCLIGLPIPGIGYGRMSRLYSLSLISKLPILSKDKSNAKIVLYERYKSSYVTGIGSRETPISIGFVQYAIMNYLTSRGYVVRSGGASGSDTYCEMGVVAGAKEIYTPWKEFGVLETKEDDNTTGYFSNEYLYKNNKELLDKAVEYASKNHPYYESLKPGVKKLMIRNVHQVLGIDLSKPSDFVIAYTKDGATSAETTSMKTGGTGTAIRLASSLNIPIINLGNYEDLKMICDLLKINIVETTIEKSLDYPSKKHMLELQDNIIVELDYSKFNKDVENLYKMYISEL